MSETLGKQFLKELEAEAPATRKCLERIPASLFTWKPHEKSMALGYLALLVAEIPKWITHMVEKGEIDFATFEHASPRTTEDLVKHFDENMARARSALQNVSDEVLKELFQLKQSGQVLFSSPSIVVNSPLDASPWTVDRLHASSGFIRALDLRSFCGRQGILSCL